MSHDAPVTTRELRAEHTEKIGVCSSGRLCAMAREVLKLSRPIHQLEMRLAGFSSPEPPRVCGLNATLRNLS